MNGAMRRAHGMTIEAGSVGAIAFAFVFVVAGASVVGGAGCKGSDPVTPVDATVTPDTPAMGDEGLNVRFASNPATWPGLIDESRQLTVTSALLRPAFLRVIGDAGPGDTRTTELVFDFGWDATTTPDTLHFPDAPSGIYSNVLVEVDGLFIKPAYEIRGTVSVGGSMHDFFIRDLDRFDVSIDSLHVELDDGGVADVTLAVDFTAAVRAVDFTKLTGDPLTLDTGDDQLEQVRDKLEKGFSIDGHGDGPAGVRSGPNPGQ